MAEEQQTMSDSSWSYTFPVWPPSTNHMYKRGLERVCLTSAARVFRQAVRAYLIEARNEGRMPKQTLRGRLTVTLVFHAPNRHVRDLDNLLKATLDALTKAALWEDDRQIDMLQVSRGKNDPQKAGCFWMNVEEM